MQEEILLLLFETLALIIYILYLVWDYSAKEVPFHIKVLTYFSWLFTFSIVLILPIDIVQAQEGNEEIEDIKLQEWITFLWRILYWSNFFLSWLILPFFQDYEASGDFSWKEKTKYSIKKNLTIYAFGLIFGIAIIIYLAFKKDLEGSDLVDALVGLANFFGLLLVVLLLGFGLVAIPKRYIKESNEEEMLYQCYRQAVYLDEQRTEKTFEIEDCCKILFQLQNEYQGSEYEQYLFQILNVIPEKIKDNTQLQQHTKSIKDIPKEYQQLNMKCLGQINKQVKQLKFDLMRIENKFELLIEKQNKLEKIDLIQNGEDCLNKFKYQFKKIWLTYLRKPYNRFIGYIFALISIFVMLGELQVLLKSKIQINYFSYILSGINSLVIFNLILLIPLTYIMFCVYYGLFGLKISGLISFNKKHHTDAPSLMFGSINFGRVSFPLCFNFLQISSQTGSKTQFIKYLKRMDEFPVFESTFSIILPLMLIIMSLCNFFNIGDKIMQAIGLGQYASQETTELLSTQGKNVLDKERQSRKQSVNQIKDNIQSQKQSFLELPKYSQIHQYSGQQSERGKTNQIRNFDDILNI